MESGGDSEKRDVRRPMNAFLIFCKRHRSIVREKNPDLDNRSVTKILGDLWANLKDQEKAMYTDLAKQYKDAFMKANPDYKWHNPEKAAGSQKPALPKPTNAKVIRNDLDMIPEGCIMPGKLADPSNMGGLSLLLMAGQQSDVKDSKSLSPEIPVSSSVLKHVNGSELHDKVMGSTGENGPLSVTSHRMETMSQIVGGLSNTAVQIKQTVNKCLAGNGYEPVWTIDGKTIDNQSKKDSLNHGRDEKQNSSGTSNTGQSLLQLAEMCSSQLGPVKRPSTEENNKKTLLYQAVAAPKVSRRSLLVEAFQDTCDSGNYPAVLKDNPVSVKKVSENQISLEKGPDTHDNDEKENITKLLVADVGEANTGKDNVEDESAMITCGKLVVNHIIDKLFSSDIATAARKMANNYADVSETNLHSVTKHLGEETALEINGNSENKSVKPSGDNNTDICSKMESSTEECVYDEHDGKSNPSDSEKQLVSKTKFEDTNKLKYVSKQFEMESKQIKIEERAVDEKKAGNGGIENKEDKYESRKRSMSLSHVSRSYEGGECENEDGDDFHPVRKSRRRNRGQRYQELINEGIIQPSKERMAALQQHAPKDEGSEEDFQSIDTYILPETAIRRIRKRTTSESAKDKLMHPDEVKRYKTGDFDLEAHIATLPACPVESMGRKRGFVRQRHYSECTYLRKTEEHPIPVFDREKIVSLPPHVKIPSPERNAKPVIGSRKRKARKHSITHLLPAPTSALSNSNGSMKTDSLNNENVSPAHEASYMESEMKTLDGQMMCNSTGDMDTFISDLRGNGDSEPSGHLQKDIAKQFDNNENKIDIHCLKYKTSRIGKHEPVSKVDQDGALENSEKDNDRPELSETGPELFPSSCDKTSWKTGTHSIESKDKIKLATNASENEDFCKSGENKIGMMDSDDKSNLSSGHHAYSALTSCAQDVNQSKTCARYCDIPVVKQTRIECYTENLVAGNQSGTDSDPLETCHMSETDDRVTKSAPNAVKSDIDMNCNTKVPS